MTCGTFEIPSSRFTPPTEPLTPAQARWKFQSCLIGYHDNPVGRGAVHFYFIICMWAGYGQSPRAPCLRPISAGLDHRPETGFERLSTQRQENYFGRWKTGRRVP
ncbi:predicted protein [Histoplasma capsulatum G186AR]|uniref:Uncharacterized protein n=1 Tax=Ajellomyces capsulatus (strain G186AR / H82 / ATCC MYA-2454 / RMSCC 2432) TaxID=447093 RepID=C0NB57_AJECG|nr:uncharacterized protein HCBG_00353 [Histoplasma capsulatum G186AR]EEH10898.1 predicted protein [Histoplasma capsulatum G186AR]